MATVTKDLTIADVLSIDRGTVPILMNNGLHCLGCPASQMETLEEAAAVHGIDLDSLLNEINDFLASKESSK